MSRALLDEVFLNTYAGQCPFKGCFLPDETCTGQGHIDEDHGQRTH